jgi:hypothetical protein
VVARASESGTLTMSTLAHPSGPVKYTRSTLSASSQPGKFLCEAHAAIEFTAQPSRADFPFYNAYGRENGVQMHARHDSSASMELRQCTASTSTGGSLPPAPLRSQGMHIPYMWDPSQSSSQKVKISPRGAHSLALSSQYSQTVHPCFLTKVLSLHSNKVPSASALRQCTLVFQPQCSQTVYSSFMTQHSQAAHPCILIPVLRQRHHSAQPCIPPAAMHHEHTNLDVCMQWYSRGQCRMPWFITS